jgi:DNA-binding MarR family transcriptional regulator
VASSMELENQIIAAIRQISQAIDLYSRFLWQQYGLTSPQLGTLRELQMRGEGTPSQIAEWLSITPGTVAGILKRLGERKLIHRKPDERDGRSVVIHVTAEGRQLAAQSPSLLRDQVRAKLAKLESWERTQILYVLQRVANLLNADDSDPTPFFVTDPPESVEANDGELSGKPSNHKRVGKRQRSSTRSRTKKRT